jgi:hypothetical protein
MTLRPASIRGGWPCRRRTGREGKGRERSGGDGRSPCSMLGRRADHAVASPRSIRRRLRTVGRRRRPSRITTGPNAATAKTPTGRRRAYQARGALAHHPASRARRPYPAGRRPQRAPPHLGRGPARCRRRLRGTVTDLLSAAPETPADTAEPLCWLLESVGARVPSTQAEVLPCGLVARRRALRLVSARHGAAHRVRHRPPRRTARTGPRGAVARQTALQARPDRPWSAAPRRPSSAAGRRGPRLVRRRCPSRAGRSRRRGPAGRGAHARRPGRCRAHPGRRGVHPRRQRRARPRRHPLLPVAVAASRRGPWLPGIPRPPPLLSLPHPHRPNRRPHHTPSTCPCPADRTLA